MQRVPQFHTFPRWWLFISIVAILPFVTSSGCSPPTPDNDIELLATAVRNGRRQSTDRRVSELVEKGAAAAPYLKNGLTDDDPFHQVAAARTLVEIEPGSSKAAHLLVSHAEHKNAELRRLVAQGLGFADPPTEEAILSLGELLTDEKDDVAEAASVSLQQIGQPAAVTALIHIEERPQLAAVLKLLPEHTIPAVLMWCREHTGLRYTVSNRIMLNQVSTLLGDAAVAPLIEAMGGDDPVIRRLAARTLEGHIDSSSEPIRQQVAKALEEYRAKEDDSAS